MNRRIFALGLLSSSAAPAFLFDSAIAKAITGTDVTEGFGFVPDGRTDNYGAFLRWIEHVNRVGGGNYVFPAGVYYVGRHVGAGARANAPIRGANGLGVFGYGARIRLDGNFHRAARPSAIDGRAGLDRATFTPFMIERSRNVSIRGFDIDGGVREMRRDPDVPEVYAYLVALHGCEDVLLEDMHLHHCQTDAVTLWAAGAGPARRAPICRNIELRNVKCVNNARGGLSIIQVWGLTCVGCSFNENGRGTGPYGAHAPQFGVTVEPDYMPPDVEGRTGNIEFRGCEFLDNATAFSGVYNERVEGYFHVIDCTSSNRYGHTYPITLSWPGAVIQGGVHDGGTGTIWLSWHHQRGGDVIIRDCEIRTAGAYGVFHAFPGNIVRMENVRIVGTHREAAAPGWVLSLQGDPGAGRRNLLRNCDIFIPASRKSAAHIYDYEVSLHHTSSAGNRFRTDLTPAGSQHFCTEYGPRTIARGDLYRGRAPGPHDSFRPRDSSSHDTRLPFSTS
jgi:hypothetical protein